MPRGSALKDSGLDLDKENCDEIGVHHRLRHRRAADDQRAVENLARARPGPAFAVHDSDAHSQHGLRPVLDVFQSARAELRHLLRLRHRQPRHRRGLAHHQDGRRAGDVRRRRGGGGRAHRHRRLLRDASHEHAQRRSASTPRARSTRTATASSWAKARASSCWRNWNTPKNAARGFIANWPATATPPTRIISPRRRPAAKARRAA